MCFTEKLVSLIYELYSDTWNGINDEQFKINELDSINTVSKLAKIELSQERLELLRDSGSFDEIINSFILISNKTKLLKKQHVIENFLKTFEDKKQLTDALLNLLFGSEDIEKRIDQFITIVQNHDKIAWELSTFFTFILDTDKEIFIDPDIVNWLSGQTSSKLKLDSSVTGENYNKAKELYQKVIGKMSEYGVKTMLHSISIVHIAEKSHREQIVSDCSYGITRWFGPILDVLRDSGGSAKSEDIPGLISKKLDLSSDITEETFASGKNRYENQVSFAKQYLVWQGLIENSDSSEWKLTPEGEITFFTAEDAYEVYRKWVKANREYKIADSGNTNSHQKSKTKRTDSSAGKKPKYNVNQIKALASPFNKFFSSADEANFFFNLFNEAYKRLGIETFEDKRVSILLNKTQNIICFDFLGYDIICIENSNNTNYFELILKNEPKSFDYFKKEKFEQLESVYKYSIPLQFVKTKLNMLLQSWYPCLDELKKNTEIEETPNKAGHNQLLADAIIDAQMRIELLIEGLEKPNNFSEDKQSTDDDKQDIDSNAVDLECTYTLEQFAEDTHYEKEWLEMLIRSIEFKKQIILYGPTGAGKTFIAEKLSKYVLKNNDGIVETVQFHPSYSYEEFVEEILPHSTSDGLDYSIIPGRFIEFCNMARELDSPCVYIIEEINRANLSQVFGEMTHLLEHRNKEITLSSGLKFSIPENVYIIGTMNTADRIHTIDDFAIRRRFRFISVKPNMDILKKFHEKTEKNIEPLVEVIDRINKKINNPNFEIGISYFMHKKLDKTFLSDIWQMEIEPYLETYFSSKPESIKKYRWAVIEKDIEL